MPKARMRFELGEDGTIERGLIAGGLPIDQLLVVLATASTAFFDEDDPASMMADDFDALFGDAIRNAGDLDRVGETCSAMSATFEFDAVPAFTFE